MRGRSGKYFWIREGENHGAIPTHREAGDGASRTRRDGSILLVDKLHNVVGHVIIVVWPRHAVRRGALSRRWFSHAYSIRRQRIPGGVPAVVAIRHHDDHLRGAPRLEGIHDAVEVSQSRPVRLPPIEAVEIICDRVPARRRPRVRRRQVDDDLLAGAQRLRPEGIGDHRSRRGGAREKLERERRQYHVISPRRYTRSPCARRARALLHRTRYAPEIFPR